jgi:hypothetical protein
MCFTAGGSGALPKPAPVAPPPSTASIEALAAKKQATDAAAATQAEVTTLKKRQGTYGNVRTTTFGDTGYGLSSFARFGQKAA